MFRLNFVLMLSTIIPILDCCSSFTLFHRKSFDLYSNAGIERSMHKFDQFQQKINLNQDSIPTLITTEKEELVTFFSHKHHLHLENSEDSDEDDENLKLNRSQRSKLQNEEYHAARALLDDINPVSLDPPNKSRDSDGGIVDKQSPPMDDAQYKLMSEIVSLECVDILRLEFCLNGGRCFLYPILNHSLSSCECAEGFVGERCEAKSYDFFPKIHRPRLVLAKTVGGPLVIGLALIDILFLLFLFCKNCNRD